MCICECFYLFLLTYYFCTTDIISFLKEDFIRKSTKIIILTKYIHISHVQLHIQTLYIIQNKMFTMANNIYQMDSYRAI